MASSTGCWPPRLTSWLPWRRTTPPGAPGRPPGAWAWRSRAAQPLQVGARDLRSGLASGASVQQAGPLAWTTGRCSPFAPLPAAGAAAAHSGRLASADDCAALIAAATLAAQPKPQEDLSQYGKGKRRATGPPAAAGPAAAPAAAALAAMAPAGKAARAALPRGAADAGEPQQRAAGGPAAAAVLPVPPKAAAPSTGVGPQLPGGCSRKRAAAAAPVTERRPAPAAAAAGAAPAAPPAAPAAVQLHEAGRPAKRTKSALEQASGATLASLAVAAVPARQHLAAEELLMSSAALAGSAAAALRAVRVEAAQDAAAMRRLVQAFDEIGRRFGA
jgi:hypothetical protein